MGSTNNAAQQNQAAQSQIQKNTSMTAEQIANWIKQNPFPLSGQTAPQAPQQQNMTFGGQQFGGTQGQQINGTPSLTPFTLPQMPQQRTTQPVARQTPQDGAAPPAVAPGTPPNAHGLPPEIIAMLQRGRGI